MGSTCEQCGKKFKVFTKRKKCMHCMTTVCKYCYAPHVATKHPSAAGRMPPPSLSSSTGTADRRERHTFVGDTRGRAAISAAYELHGGHLLDDEDDVHFLSPVNASRAALEYDDDRLLDGVEHMDVASAGEDDDDDDDEEDDDVDDEDDEEEEEEEEDEAEAYLGENHRRRHGAEDRHQQRTATNERFHKRRMSMEEEHYQYAEFLQIQDAVATWARKEKNAAKLQRIEERDSCYSMTAIPNVRSTREYQEREMFVISYAVAITLLVWFVYALGCFAYVRMRGGVVRTWPLAVYE